MNYYSVLGLNPNASDADVKKAYRKLASKHHPDKGGDIEQFKKVQEAYEKITSGEGNQPEWRRHEWEDFSQQHTHNQYVRNPDKIVEINLSLHKAIEGTDVLVESGPIREVILIPPNSKEGDRIRLKGKGFQRFRGVPPGDLIIRINVTYPPGVTVKELDVYHRVQISSLDAITGSDQIVEHYTGKKLNIKVPPGSQHGAKLRVGGWGLKNARRTGNYYVIISLYTPTLTPEQIEQIKTITTEANDEQ